MRRAKYGNIKTEFDGVLYDSKREAKRAGELALLQRAGQISDLKRQERFALVVNDQPICTYVCDFSYRDHTGQRVIEDSKGFQTPEFKLKAKLMKAVHGVEVLIT